MSDLVGWTLPVSNGRKLRAISSSVSVITTGAIAPRYNQERSLTDSG
ncbi:hypothetical protein [Moorena sp. SIO3I8]|nr:hypothetical protein [Moorena sp. SIO3I8]NEO10724.1 hypothetical protein [Moorena sp. SIO3I8]